MAVKVATSHGGFQFHVNYVCECVCVCVFSASALLYVATSDVVVYLSDKQFDTNLYTIDSIQSPLSLLHMKYWMETIGNSGKLAEERRVCVWVGGAGMGQHQQKSARNCDREKHQSTLNKSADKKLLINAQRCVLQDSLTHGLAVISCELLINIDCLTKRNSCCLLVCGKESV